MEHRTVVYYAFCKREGGSPRAYKAYQRQAADKLLSYGMQEQFGVVFSREWVEVGEHGKPYWCGPGGIYFNISNTAGVVVCAVASQEVGVDAERIRRVGCAVAKRCCGAKELAYIMGDGEGRPMGQELGQSRFFQLWTLKESYLKMTGQGLCFPIREVEFSIEGEGGEIFCSQPGFFWQKRLGEYWVSLCTREASEVVWKEWELDVL